MTVCGYWNIVACRASLLSRLVFFLALVFASLGFSAPAQAQAVVTWDYMSVSANGGDGSLQSGDSVAISTTVDFFFYFYDGWTYSSTPSGCNISHVSDNHWRGTITGTCRIAGEDVPIVIESTGSEAATVGADYSGGVRATGGDSPYTYALEVSGSLPAGLTLDDDGTISGTPGEEGAFRYTVRATNGYGHTQTRSFDLTVHSAAAAPTITGILPDTGTADGGTAVTITGANLTGANAVTFGGVAATSYAVDSDTQISAVTPPGTAGAVDVTVTTPGGADTEADGFTYLSSTLPVLSISDVVVVEGDLAAFTISLDRPASSPVTMDIATADGTAIAGEDYQPNSVAGVPIVPGETSRTFARLTYDDSIQEPDETFFVNVTNVTGATVAVSQGVATIKDNDAPLPTANPVSATVTSGTRDNPIALNITGAPADSVAVASDPAHGTATASGTTITYTPGRNYAGPDSFTYTATNAAGTSAPATVTIDINDLPPPDLAFTAVFETPLDFNIAREGRVGYFLSVAPTDGSLVLNADGTTKYTPNAGFSGTDEFEYDIGAYGNTGKVTITVDPPTIAYAPTNPPAGTVGATYSQSIAGGASGGTAPYTYAHVSGTMAPGLTLSADGMLSGTPDTAGTFTFGVVATDSSTGTGPFSSPPTTVSVTIGQSSPTITGISPVTGPIGGGTSVTIRGTNLTDAGSVTFDRVAAASYTVESATQITAVTPAGSAGAVDITVTTPAGAATWVNGFTYEAPAPNPYLVTVSDGTYREGDTIHLGVYFDADIEVSGNPRLQINIGGTIRYADYYDHALVRARFRYVVQAGDLAPSGIGLGPSILLNGGTIESTDGTAANLTLNGIPDLSGVIVDAVAPTVASSAVSGSPAPDATTAGFDVTFSEQVNGVDRSDFVLTTTGSATGTVAGIGTADGVTYHVNVTGISGIGSLRLDVLADRSITDLADNPMTVAYTSGAPWARGGSTDATLASLTPSAGALDPTFDPATTGYAVTVDHATDSITLTPTAADVDATITVDGQMVASGSASQPIALTVGDTAISVIVRAEDGTTTRTYTVTVTRAASAVATLAGLVPSTGALDPTFDPATTAYAVTVDNVTDSITLTPTVADADATITVDGQTVASGSASQPIALTVGDTAISVVVTAEDGTTTQSYTVTVTRVASADATLASLTPNAGVLDPAFDPATTAYAVAVDHATDSITLTPTAADADATITVDGQAVASGSASQPIALTVGDTAISVVVTAEDGTTTQSYTVTVTRAASADATLAGLVPSSGALDPTFDPATTAYAVAVDNATDSITLTPTAADTNATITVDGQAVASGSASQQIALTVGDTAIHVVVGAEDGATTQAYTVTVTRAPSADAALASLTPSTGALDPAFNPETTGYGVAVDNATDSITLTPTAAQANATITVDGQAVASGNTSQAIALAVGSTEIPVTVLAQDGTTTRTYTVTVERALSVPVVISRTIEVNAGEMARIDLTEGASGGPFIDAAIVDRSNADSGTAQIERDGQTYRLVFVSSPTFAGDSSVRFTVSNSAGASAPGTIMFRVLARPDPSLDPEVIGLIRAQSETAKRFANIQITNFNQRLEQLHNEGEQRSNALGFNLSVQQPASANAYGPREDRSDDAALGAIGEAAPTAATPQSAPPEDVFGDLAFWSGGYVNFGTNDDGAINLDHTLVGISGGVDYRFTPELTAGLGIGYGRDVTDVGANGTESRAEAFSLAAYGSYRPMPGFFIDGLAGYSTMSFDSLRYVAATSGFATGTRSGDQFFGSLTAGYEYRNEGLLISPYGRLSGSHSTLDSFTETGVGSWNLAYGEQSIDTLSATLGLRLEYAIPTDWGVLTPRGRLEYTHDFEGSSRASLGYADIGTTPYNLDIEGFSRDHITLGLGLDAQIGEAVTLGLDYRTAFGADGDSQDHTFGFKLGVQF